ncbi:MAG: AMIN domain-containing protein, partial [Kamptonema sp. SIO4C4]|nr:AMIN domain-containing protein [Kamptonema sp. SIO4C4]
MTGVQLQRTETGLEIILATSSGQQPQTFRISDGNTLAIDLTDTQLSLPEGKERVFQENPAADIASVEVVQQSPN